MRLLAITLLSIVCVNAQQEPAQPAADPEDDPRSKLDSTIEFALQLLKEQKYQEYIEQLAFPADLKKALENRELDDLVASFKKDKAEVTLSVLKKIKDAKPKLNEAGTVAEFPVDENYFFARDRIVFEKSDGLWYVRN